MQQLRCHRRMQDLYRSLGDFEMTEEEEAHYLRLAEDMELNCGVCNQSIGERSEKLDALPCCHIVHAR